MSMDPDAAVPRDTVMKLHLHVPRFILFGWVFFFKVLLFCSSFEFSKDRK